MRRVLTGLVLAGLVLPGMLSGGETETARALGLLLAIGEVRMNTAACRKNTQAGRAVTVREDVAERLATFGKGENRVMGECKGRECTVRMSHRDGEDVWSALYRFRLTGKGIAVRESLECGWTP